jgi:RsiW-degrading membrane proteinase PrsW (M82 family)
MNYPFYIILGLAPSFIWLLFFLRKDSHPESNRMILKIFIYGMIAAALAAAIELGIFKVFSLLNIEQISPLLALILYHFIAIALIEELIKYLVVRQNILKNQEFDEPVDAMLYMIIAALGFAALENILVLFPIGRSFLDTMYITGFRFIGATFLHALCSAVIGYFLALSLFETKKRFRLIATGLIISSLLHGLYNLSIINIVNDISFIIIPIIILIGLALFVSSGFRRLKRIASTCKVKT